MRFRLLLSLLVVGSLLGCGGSNASRDYHAPSQFVGAWRGTWALDGHILVDTNNDGFYDNVGPDNGIVNISVDEYSQVSGSIVNGSGTAKIVEGNFDKSGVFTWTAKNVADGATTTIVGRAAVANLVLSGDGVWTNPDGSTRSFTFNSTAPQ